MKMNLKIVRKHAGLTQAQASEATGIPLGTLRRWEQGVNEPDMESVVKLAELYGVSTDTILGSKFAEDIDGLERVAFTSFVDTPLYGSISAGVPIEMVPVDDTHPIPGPMHDMYPDAFLLRVNGRSMDRILPDGCYALVDPCREVVKDGAAYAVAVNGNDATIKRVKKLSNGFELVPDSTDPTYKPKVYDYGEDGTEEITVIGRVVWFCVPFDWNF